MEEDPASAETLFRRVTEYSLTYFELIKLKAINKITDVISTVFPDVIVSILFLVFMLFINLGLALWLGDILGKLYLGFLVVAAFYFLMLFVSHFFMRGWFKKVAANYLIKQFLK